MTAFRTSPAPAPEAGVRLSVLTRIRHSKAGRIAGLWTLAGALTAFVTGLAAMIALVAGFSEDLRAQFVGGAGGLVGVVLIMGAMAYTIGILDEGKVDRR